MIASGGVGNSEIKTVLFFLFSSHSVPFSSPEGNYQQHLINPLPLFSHIVKKHTKVNTFFPSDQWTPTKVQALVCWGTGWTRSFKISPNSSFAQFVSTWDLLLGQLTRLISQSFSPFCELKDWTPWTLEGVGGRGQSRARCSTRWEVAFIIFPWGAGIET